MNVLNRNGHFLQMLLYITFVDMCVVYAVCTCNCIYIYLTRARQGMIFLDRNVRFAFYISWDLHMYYV